MFTEATGNATVYTQVNPDKSIWDNGNTQWDFNGNIYASDWDAEVQAYTERSGNSLVYGEPKGIEWDNGASRWDLDGNVITSYWDL